MSYTRVVGTIDKVYKNSMGYYNFAIGDVWYGTGSKSEPAFNEGDAVEFEWELKGKFKNIVKGTLKASTAIKETANSSGAGVVTSNARERTTRYHAARMSAIEFVVKMVEIGHFKLPAAKAGANLDIVQGRIDDLTVQWYNATAELPDRFDEVEDDLPPLGDSTKYED